MTFLSVLTTRAAGVQPGGPDLARQALLLVVLLSASSLVWWLVSRRRGHFSQAAIDRSPGDHLDPDLRDLPLGDVATFVQFSSATCSTCPGVRRILTDVAAGTPGVAVVELAAEEHMDLVRRLRVLRTPTVLLLGPDATIRSRTSGPVTGQQARAALHHLQPTSTGARHE